MSSLNETAQKRQIQKISPYCINKIYCIACGSYLFFFSSQNCA